MANIACVERMLSALQSSGLRQKGLAWQDSLHIRDRLHDPDADVWMEDTRCYQLPHLIDAGICVRNYCSRDTTEYTPHISRRETVPRVQAALVRRW